LDFKNIDPITGKQPTNKPMFIGVIANQVDITCVWDLLSVYDQTTEQYSSSNDIVFAKNAFFANVDKEFCILNVPGKNF